MQMWAHIGLLYFVTEVKLFISVVLVLNMFLKKLNNLSGIKTIANIFRIQTSNSVMCGYLSIGFIGFMLAGIKLTDFTGLFSPYNFKKNDNIILSYFKDG